VILRARIGLGTLRLDDEDAAAMATIGAALDAGIRVFDTARAYGESERRLGAALVAHPDAEVITKGGMARPGGQWRADGRAATLRRDCEESLRVLARPIDLYLVHAPDPRVAWATTVRAWVAGMGPSPGISPGCSSWPSRVDSATRTSTPTRWSSSVGRYVGAPPPASSPSPARRFGTLLVGGLPADAPAPVAA